MKYPNMQKLTQAYFSDPNYEEHVRTHYKMVEQILHQTKIQLESPWDSSLFYNLTEIFERKGIMDQIGEEPFAIARISPLTEEHKSKIEELIPKLLTQLEHPDKPFAELFEMPTRCY